MLIGQQALITYFLKQYTSITHTWFLCIDNRLHYLSDFIRIVWRIYQPYMSLYVQEVIFFCVREEPVVFLHLDQDFIPYTPRRKKNLHENLHDLRSMARAEQLELSIRKEAGLAVFR